MKQQSSALGPEVGWGVGLVGFAATAVIGWLMDAGVGFMLVLLVFWGGIGGLFAFLVDRSTTEEHDRVEELQNTRLATLGVAPRPAQTPVAAEPVVATQAAAAVVEPSPTPKRASAAPSNHIAPSPRSYRERRAEAEGRSDTDHRSPEARPDRTAAREERDRAAAAMLASALQNVDADVRDRRGGSERRGGAAERAASSAPGRPAPPAPRRPAPSAPQGAERARPRSPREYREAKLEADARRDQAAA